MFIQEYQIAQSCFFVELNLADLKTQSVCSALIGIIIMKIIKGIQFFINIIIFGCAPMSYCTKKIVPK